jgi:hypothetical protein
MRIVIGSCRGNLPRLEKLDLERSGRHRIELEPTV